MIGVLEAGKKNSHK